MKNALLAALAAGAMMVLAPATAEAKDGCGSSAYRNNRGYCVPKRGYDRGGYGYRRDRHHGRPVVGRYYDGRGYYHNGRYWRERYRHRRGGWRYR